MPTFPFSLPARFGWPIDSGEPLYPKGEQDRFRVIVQNTRAPYSILSRDLNVADLQVMRALSGPCMIEFKVSPYDESVKGINFKAHAQYIHLEKTIMGERRIWATGIVQPSTVDKKTGVLNLRAEGFSAYPKGIPWLQDWNPLVVDALEPVHKIWDHIQSYPNGDLNVEVYPLESNVEMLPGYAFDGDILSFDFFAQFIRASDKRDCGDHINGLARDIPFDYFEESSWNVDRTDINKKIHLAYPRGGTIQNNLAFIINENVYEAEPFTEAEIDYVTDVGVKGFWPGKEYSFELSNADPERLRRYLKEDDAQLNSNERTAAWARKRLARRQTPPHWKSIIVDMYHPNAPFGYYDVGDTITVKGNMPWHGEVIRDHKIIAISVQEATGTVQLTLKAEGAFNYDPIFFPDDQVNIINNNAFQSNLDGWTPSTPGWVFDPGQGFAGHGSARFTASGITSEIVTQKYGVRDWEFLPVEVVVKGKDLVSDEGTTPIQLVVRLYENETVVGNRVISGVFEPTGEIAWQRLKGQTLIPDDATHAALRLVVTNGLTSGTMWFDDAVMVI